MADSSINITAGAGTSIDTRTETTNLQHRQVIVVGDPALNANVAAVATQDVGGGDQTTAAVLTRLAGSAAVQIVGSISTIGVYLSATAGTIAANVGTISGTAAVFFSPSAPAVRDISATAVLPVTASSTSSAVSVSGATVISPVVGSVIKVFAFSLTTTAQVHLAARFTNGAGTSPTEFWRVALLAPAAGVSGANLAVTPPGYIWSTASGSTLSLVLDSASLVHYSVGYFRESA